MAEEQKPVVASEAPVIAEPAAPEAPAAEPAAEATPAATEGAATTETPAAEETKAAEPAKKVAEPIYSGALGYKAPGVLKSLIFSKKYFWFGEEAVPTSSLNSYLRGEKPEVSHSTAAWSSHTGKGLLYFAKHADEKNHPAGVLNLSEASDLKKEGSIEFSFRLHGSKHTFETKQALERDGWFLALEKGIEEAKASAEGVKSSDGYKEALEKLNKPAATAAAIATGSAPKKSAEEKPAEGEIRPTSEDEGKKSKSKSRSVSRGKRNSIFGRFLDKKEEHEVKKEEKKEEKAEESTAAPVAAEATPAEPAATEPVAAVEPIVTAPVTEETKPAETEAPAAEAAVAAPEAEASKPAPKPTKRNSVIGNFFEKIRSPTQEKKLSEVAPPVPAKDEAKEPEVPVAEEPAAALAAEPAPATTTETAAAPVEEAKPAEAATATTPKKDKKGFSFDKVFGSVKERVKSPTTEKAPAAPVSEEAPKIEETPKVEEAPAAETAAVPATETAEAPKIEEAPATEAAPVIAEPPKERRKSSFFGGLGGSVKKEKKADTNGDVKTDEKKSSKLSGLFRNPSKAVKGKKEKETTKTDEAAPEASKEETAAEPAAATEEKKEEAAPAPTEPAIIGDVVPEAVSVGQAPSSTPTVQATA